jgi:hypothetical protein
VIPRPLAIRVIQGISASALLGFLALACEGSSSDSPLDPDAGANGEQPGAPPGSGCQADNACASQICKDGVCSQPSPTDGKKNGDETDTDCGGKSAPPCETTKGCKVATDCKTLACKNGTCATPTADDGVKNATETDVDCGGPDAGTPRCATDRGCKESSDCLSLVCDTGKKACNAPSPTDQAQNGTETDVDCGGANAPACLAGKKCEAPGDCVSGGCDYNKKCADEKSCVQHYGGDTCGTGEVGAAGAQHETCCKSIEVPGYTTGAPAGKKVYVDKYEVTAGRVRAFLADLAARNNGKPNMKAFIAANKPAIWNDGWNLFLAEDTDAATNVTMPHPSGGATASVNPANLGTNYGLGSSLYVYVHGHNCFMGQGAFGFPTYWYPDAVQAGQNGGKPRLISKDELDAKSITCIPNAWLAAFCHWDGGQLATSDVLQAITGATISATGVPSSTGVSGRLPARASSNFSNDSGTTPTTYLYPVIAYVPGKTDHEGASRIAAPGRLAADRTASAPAGADKWADLRGNVNEVALVPASVGATAGFRLLYEGIGFGSARAGGNSNTRIGYPEYKAAYSGGRCMRFK